MRFFASSPAARRSLPFSLDLKTTTLGLAAVLSLGSASAVFAQVDRGNLAPAIARSGVSLGLESPTAAVSGTVWLNLHNKAELDAAVKQMYIPGSPSFHKWMAVEDLKRFEPTAAELAAVKAELAAHHLSVLSVDAANLSVKFTGQVSDFESAFHTQLGRYQLGPQVVRATGSAPQLAGLAAGLSAGVTGLSGLGARPFHSAPVDPETGKPLGVHPVAGTSSPAGAYFSSQCFYPVKTIQLANGGVTATYSGLTYGASIANTEPGTVASCAYSPQDVWGIYNLNSVYGLGYQGQGQTIAIVDAYGSPTIAADALTFNNIYHLTKFTPSSFQIYNPNPVTATDAGWATETTLDVEWAHAIAPQANIALIATPTNRWDDLQSGVLYAIINKLGNVISNSYGGPESLNDPTTMTTWDEINEFAASLGISVNFATGDEGDYAAYVEQYTGVATPDVSIPANSPYATAIGGTSVAFSPFDGSVVQTGWGTNFTRLDYKTGEIADPPLLEGFEFGGGGGISAFFAKPDYQAGLTGPGRHLPDVSALADPYTGAEIVITVGDAQYYEAYGGTSLATPIFSAMWALVNEYVGAPVGQAAPYMSAGTAFLADVLATADPFNVTGSITDSQGTTKYSSAELSQPLDGTTGYTGALYQGGSTAYYNITFGTDSSLTVGPGWDSVTGYGTPDFGKFLLH